MEIIAKVKFRVEQEKKNWGYYTLNLINFSCNDITAVFIKVKHNFKDAKFANGTQTYYNYPISQIL